jgi:hypothetical protein
MSKHPELKMEIASSRVTYLEIAEELGFSYSKFTSIINGFTSEPTDFVKKCREIIKKKSNKK